MSKVTSFSPAAISYDCCMVCKPLHYVTIMSSGICKRLVLCCWLAGLLFVNHIPTTYSVPKFGSLWLTCHFFLWGISCLEDFMLRHKAHRAVGCCLCHADLHSDCCVSCSYIYVETVSLCLESVKSLFHLFLHDCGFHHLWQLYLPLGQTFSKGVSGH